MLRPSLRRRPYLLRRFTPVTAYATRLVTAGPIPVGNTIWSACEEVTLRLGGPRSGKSLSLACHGLDAPGALLVTSSRKDLLEHTERARARKGRVDVFNPTGLGGLPSTVRWSVLAGCTDYATALRRAADLIPEGGSSEGERWDAQARGLLAVLMHAAALQGGNLRTVLDWISPADALAREQILQALAESGAANERALASDVRSIYATNERTLTSITTTMLPALRWLNDTTAAEIGDANLDDPDFLDVELVRRPQTGLPLPDRPRRRRPHPPRRPHRRGRPPGPDDRRRRTGWAAGSADDGATGRGAVDVWADPAARLDRRHGR